MNTRGAVMLEGLIAFLPIFAGFLGLCQVCDQAVHQLVMCRAALTAARAGALVLPDDGLHYADSNNRGVHRFAGGRKAAIEAMVAAVLRGAEGLSRSHTTVEVQASTVVARVEAEYRCLFASLCHASRLSAEARLPYPHAAYDYVTRE
ncbi:MAG TPA: hypothetical protein VJR89_25260 [Polyangiales bacterium]|nr:hypothetical protein [Polyangiales bacterium]